MGPHEKARGEKIQGAGRQSDGGVALAASRSRSNEPPRQIEDGAHKLLRAAASCACLELACTQTSLEAGPPSTVPIACACGLLNARLATQLDQGAARAVPPPCMLVLQQR